MAAIQSTRWQRLVLRVGNGADPEVKAPLCTINAARGITINAATNEDTIPDCDDLEKIQWLIREKVSLSVEVTGSGKTHKSDVKKCIDFVMSPDPRSCDLVLDDPDPANVITLSGLFHMNTFSTTGDPGAPAVTSDTSLQSTGEIAATYGANVGGAG